MPEYVSPGRIRAEYQISYTALASWADQDKVRCVKTPGGSRKYHLGDVLTLLGADTDRHNETKKRVILYAQVSSRKQSADLPRQVDQLVAGCPIHDEIITDIGSGLNWKRPGFVRLLDSIRQGRVEKVVLSMTHSIFPDFLSSKG